MRAAAAPRAAAAGRRAQAVERVYRGVGPRARTEAYSLSAGGLARLDLLGELLELLGERGAEALELGRLLAVAAEAELGGELVLVEQVLLGALGGLDRLDLERAVVLEAGRGRDQLADDHVLLEADEAVALALEGGVGEHLRRLLEGGRREERLGRERGLGDPEDHLLGPWPGCRRRP